MALTRTPPLRKLLPLVWTIGCVIGFANPGDEYGLFAIGSIIGLWAALLMSGSGPALLPVLLAGAAIMCGLGLLLDRLCASRRLWLLTWIATSIVLCVTAVAQHPSVEAAVAKNGSLLAFATYGSQLGTYLATVVVLITAGTRTGLRRLRTARAASSETVT